MKKILLVAAIASTFMAFADGSGTSGTTGSNATEVQQIGITAITTSRQSVIVAFSYEGVTADKLVKTTNLTVGDELHGFVDDEYTTWTLLENETTGSKYWYADTQSGRGGIKDGTPAVEFSQAVGTGIWLVRKDGPTESYTFHIYGTPATSKEITIDAGTTMLIGNPNSGEKSPTITNAAKGDAIYIPNGIGFAKYIYNGDGEYGSKGKWYNGFTALDNPPIFDANTGAWYESKGSNDVKINWE